MVKLSGIFFALVSVSLSLGTPTTATAVDLGSSKTLNPQQFNQVWLNFSTGILSKISKNPLPLHTNGAWDAKGILMPTSSLDLRTDDDAKAQQFAVEARKMLETGQSRTGGV